MTKLSYVRLTCDSEDCVEWVLIPDPGSAHDLRLAAGRYGWLIQRGEWCPTHRVQQEVMGSTVAQ